MREVKEKSPLKERAAETLKSAPQAAFRRGTHLLAFIIDIKKCKKTFLPSAKASSLSLQQTPNTIAKGTRRTRRVPSSLLLL